MAIKQNRPAAPTSATPIRDYWPRYQKRSLAFIMAMQFITMAVVGGALIVSGAFELTDIPFWIALIAIVLGSTGVNLIVFSLVSEPVKNIMNALTHVAGEPTLTTPPNPNARRFSQTGLKQVLQTVYELGSSDITTSSNTQLNPEANQSAIKAALDNTRSGFVVLSSQREVIYHNSHAPVHIDTDNKPVLDLTFINEQSLDEWLNECEEHSVRAEKTWQRVANKIAGEEDRRLFDIFVSYQKGSEAETVITLVDRTESYQPEEDELDFIAFAAHELRGPITVIRGYLDVLQDELNDTIQNDQKELLKRLVVSSNRLSSYINNILNASRFDRRHLQVHLHEESVADIYSTIADDMQLRAAAQNRMLGVTISPDLPKVAADRGSIGEVLGNLIDNAIKYSNEGGAVSVFAEAKGDFVEVSVQDQGIGMPSNVVSSLFHKFYRSHRSRETVAGTGIGLYITKAFVESHGGIISVRSAEGVGSTFTFTLPIYSTVADKLAANQNNNQELIRHGSTGGWIKNHSMYRG